MTCSQSKRHLLSGRPEYKKIQGKSRNACLFHFLLEKCVVAAVAGMRLVSLDLQHRLKVNVSSGIF